MNIQRINIHVSMCLKCKQLVPNRQPRADVLNVVQRAEKDPERLMRPVRVQRVSHGTHCVPHFKRERERERERERDRERDRV